MRNFPDAISKELKARRKKKSILFGLEKDRANNIDQSIHNCSEWGSDLIFSFGQIIVAHADSYCSAFNSKNPPPSVVHRFLFLIYVSEKGGPPPPPPIHSGFGGGGRERTGGACTFASCHPSSCSSSSSPTPHEKKIAASIPMTNSSMSQRAVFSTPVHNFPSDSGFFFLSFSLPRFLTICPPRGGGGGGGGGGAAE